MIFPLAFPICNNPEREVKPFRGIPRRRFHHGHSIISAGHFHQLHSLRETRTLHDRFVTPHIRSCFHTIPSRQLKGSSLSTSVLSINALFVHISRSFKRGQPHLETSPQVTPLAAPCKLSAAVLPKCSALHRPLFYCRSLPWYRLTSTYVLVLRFHLGSSFISFPSGHSPDPGGLVRCWKGVQSRMVGRRHFPSAQGHWKRPTRSLSWKRCTIAFCARCASS